MRMPFIPRFVHLYNKVQQGNLSYRFVHAASWAVIGAIAARGITLISYIWVARILAQEVYGEFGILRSTINMFTVFAGMGLGATASKYIAQFRNSNPNKAGEIYMLSNFLILFIGGLFAVLLFFLAPYIADSSLHAPHLTNEIKVGAIVLFFIAVNSVQNGALSGFEDFKSIALNTFYSGSIQAVCLIVGCYWNGLLGMLIGWGIGCCSCYLLNRHSIHKQLKKYQIKYIFNRIPKDNLTILWKFSLPSLLASIMVMPVLWWSKTYLIGKSDYAEMAVFDVTEQWSTMVLFIPSTLSQIILPLLTNTLVEGTANQYSKLIKVNIFLNVCVAFLFSLFVLLIGPFIMGLYGENFINLKALAFMMGTTIASSACNVVGQVIASQDKMWLGFVFNLLWATWVALFTVLFVGYFNMAAAGLALAIFVSYTIHFICQTIYIKQFKYLNS